MIIPFFFVEQHTKEMHRARYRRAAPTRWPPLLNVLKKPPRNKDDFTSAVIDVRVQTLPFSTETFPIEVVYNTEGTYFFEELRPTERLVVPAEAVAQLFRDGDLERTLVAQPRILQKVKLAFECDGAEENGCLGVVVDGNVRNVRTLLPANHRKVQGDVYYFTFGSMPDLSVRPLPSSGSGATADMPYAQFADNGLTRVARLLPTHSSEMEFEYVSTALASSVVSSFIGNAACTYKVGGEERADFVLADLSADESVLAVTVHVSSAPEVGHLSGDVAFETDPPGRAKAGSSEVMDVVDAPHRKMQPALTPEEVRIVINMLDEMENQRRSRLDVRDEGSRKEKKLTYARIGELINRHKNTVYKIKVQRDKQRCVRVLDHEEKVKTVDVPVSGTQGGFRSCRMSSDEQKQYCTRLAIENPRMTIAEINASVQEKFPSLQGMADSTVWRTLHMANLQYLRAKMRDPRSEGTGAHKAEKKAFLAEQQKGDDGLLRDKGLFFMDETTVYMNETVRKAWGTREHPAEIKKAKGKTMTIGIYAGLGLVDDHHTAETWQRRLHAQKKKVPSLPTDPRSNMYALDGEGRWQLADDAPRFALFWWLRPTTRATTVLSRFLDADDICDPNFKLNVFVVNPGSTSEHAFRASVLHTYAEVVDEQAGVELEATQTDDVLRVRVQGTITTALGSVQVSGTTYKNAIQFSAFDASGNVRYDIVEAFLASDFDSIAKDDELAVTLWLNGIEHRQTDGDGNLSNVVTGKSRVAHKVQSSASAMRAYLKSMQNLVARAVLHRKSIDELRSTRLVSAPAEDFHTFLRRFDMNDFTKIPRAYYSSNGRQFLGGSIDSERGDQSLFLRYLRLSTDYYDAAFPTPVRQNLRMAWDSAAQHGKVDVTKNKKSFIHAWVQEKLKIAGAIFLPVREPDFNPTELLFSFVKGVVRRKMQSPMGVLSEDEMIRLVDRAFLEVTESMVKGWLKYGCYVVDGDASAPSRARRCGYGASVDTSVFMWRLVDKWLASNPDARIDYAACRKLVDPEVRRRLLSRYQSLSDVFSRGDCVVYAVRVGTQREFDAPRNAMGLYAGHDELRLLTQSLKYVEVVLNDASFALEVEKRCRVQKSLADNRVVFLRADEYEKERDNLSTYVASAGRATDGARTFIRDRMQGLLDESHVGSSYTLQDGSFWAGGKRVAMDGPDANIVLQQVCPLEGGPLIFVDDAGAQRTCSNLASDEDAFERPIALRERLLLFLDKERIGSPKEEDNYARPEFRELDSIFEEAKDDLAIISRYVEVYCGKSGTPHRVSHLRDLLRGRSGELSVLSAARDEAERIASRLDIRAKSASEIANLLLDSFERIFLPQADRDTTVVVRGDKMTVARRAPRSFDDRELDIQAQTRVPPGVYQIDSDVNGAVVLKKDNLRIPIGNPRIFAALGRSIGQDDPVAHRIARLLSSTQYKSSVPSSEEPLFAAGAAVVALRAWVHENARARAAGVRFCSKFVEACGEREMTPQQVGMVDALIEETIRRWKRMSTGGSAVAEDGRTFANAVDGMALDANDAAPLFKIPTLREERRASTNLASLAKGSTKERRWPGYPLEEQDERDGIPMTEVFPGDRANIHEAMPIASLSVLYAWSVNREEYKIVDIVFEDGAEKRLGTSVSEITEDCLPCASLPDGGLEDYICNGSNINILRAEYEKVEREVFGGYASDNQQKLTHAMQRYKEGEDKKKKASEPLSNVSRSILTTFEGNTVHIRSNRFTTQDASVLFDAESGEFYPGILHARDSILKASKVDVGVLSQEVIDGRQLAPQWTSVTADDLERRRIPSRLLRFVKHVDLDAVVQSQGEEAHVVIRKEALAKPYEFIYKLRDSDTYYVPVHASVAFGSRSKIDVSFFSHKLRHTRLRWLFRLSGLRLYEHKKMRDTYMIPYRSLDVMQVDLSQEVDVRGCRVLKISATLDYERLLYYLTLDRAYLLFSKRFLLNLLDGMSMLEVQLASQRDLELLRMLGRKDGAYF